MIVHTKSIILVLYAFFVCSVGFGQATEDSASPTDQTSVLPAPPAASHPLYQGLKLGVFFMQLKGNYNDDGDKKEEGLGPGYGLTTGIAYLPVHEIGSSANFAVMQLFDHGQKSYRARIDANANYAFNKRFSVKAGINFVAPIAPIVERSEFSVGWQNGISYQFNPQFAMDLNLVQMRINYNSPTEAHSATIYTGTEVVAFTTF